MINHSVQTNVRRRRGAVRRTGTVGFIVLTVAASAAAPTGSVAAEDDFGETRYIECMRASASTPDALEHYVGGCRAQAVAATASYTECIGNASGTADALEHWVRICADRV